MVVQTETVPWPKSETVNETVSSLWFYICWSCFGCLFITPDEQFNAVKRVCVRVRIC